ncbi:MAG: DUF362 domain-containing protein [Bacillota bacterium]
MRLVGFKKWTFTGIAVLLSLAFVLRGFTEDAVFQPKQLPESKVAVFQSDKGEAKDITEADILEMVSNAVELAGGFDGLIKDGQTVVLKPNLVGMTDYIDGSPLEIECNGVTTDWRVTKAVAALVRRYNPHGKVYVMEGSAFKTRPIMEYFKYTPQFIPDVDEFIAIEEDSGEWEDVNSPGLSKVSLPQGLIHKEYYLNKKYKEADVLISIPCMKTHWHAAVTCGIKNVGIGATPANIYGQGPGSTGRGSMVNHNSEELHQWIHDFFLCRPVDFVVVDALQGIQNGPTPSASWSNCDEDTGPPEKMSDAQMNMRLILAGRDPVAVDTIAALIMGWDPCSVPYLQYLNQDAAGNLDTACIDVCGKSVDAVRKYFAGKVPWAGGAKLQDREAPGSVLRGWSVKKNILSISLSGIEDVHKIDIFIDGELKKRITRDFKNIGLDLKDTGKGAHQAALEIYDAALNRRELTFKFSVKKLPMEPVLKNI